MTTSSTTPFSFLQACEPRRNIAALARAACFAAANDNEQCGFDVVGLEANDDENEPALIRTALQMFAEHGLRAAREAHSNGETAFFAGDRDQYAFWVGVCRKLDRQLAGELANRSCDTRVS